MGAKMIKKFYKKPSSPSIGQNILKKTRSRVVIIIAFFVLAYGGICFRLVDLTLKTPDYIPKKTVAFLNKKPSESKTSFRGTITDRNDNILATSLTTSSLYANPQQIIDPVEAAQKLSTVFQDLDYGKILSKLQSKQQFVWIKRNLTPRQKYLINALGIPGFGFKKEKRRIYPSGTLTAHVVGYTNVDGKGLSGIENAFNDFLSSSEQDLQLTIDIAVQHILRREMLKTIKEFNAVGGAGIVMDVNTGEILALSSFPEFDPHAPTKTPMSNQFNRVTKGVYEMGSTFKIFATAALLEYTNTNIRDQFDARKPIKRAGFTIRDYHAKKRYLNVPEILIHSSNIGSAHMAEKVGTSKMVAFFNDLGLMDKADIELNEIGQPLIPKPWRDINTLTASYGHGMAVSPLQTAVSIAAIVNGGILTKPTLIKVPEKQINNYQEKRVISEKTSGYIRDMMRLVVSDGTGSKANAKGYRVGGKTGTSEKIKNGQYDKKSLFSSFVGVFPSDDPQYIVFVAIDEPKGNKSSYGYATGGWVAAPVVGNTIRDIAPLVGVQPKPDYDISRIRETMNINNPKRGRRLASF